MLSKAANCKWKRITQHQNPIHYLCQIQSVTYAVTEKTLTDGFVCLQKSSTTCTHHICLAPGCFIPTQVKCHPPYQKSLSDALRTGYKTIWESFFRQHCCHFSLEGKQNKKNIDLFSIPSSKQACWRFRRYRTVKPSLRILSLQQSSWYTLQKACSS